MVKPWMNCLLNFQMLSSSSMLNLGLWKDPGWEYHCVNTSKVRWFKSRTEWRTWSQCTESRSHANPDIGNVHRQQMNLFSSWDWKWPIGRSPQRWKDKIVKQFEPIWSRKVRARTKMHGGQAMSKILDNLTNKWIKETLRVLQMFSSRWKSRWRKKKETLNN